MKSFNSLFDMRREEPALFGVTGQRCLFYHGRYSRFFCREVLPEAARGEGCSTPSLLLFALIVRCFTSVGQRLSAGRARAAVPPRKLQEKGNS